MIVLIALFGVSRYYSVKGDLVAARESVNAQWSRVDEALQQRADLIPNLVEAAQDFAGRESAVCHELADARAALARARTPQEEMAANDRLSTALSRLLLAAETYPRSKSNAKFLRFQDELADKWDRIAVERRKYNETLEHYNVEIQRFPANLVAGIAGFSRDDAYFPTGPDERAVPKGQF